MRGYTLDASVDPGWTDGTQGYGDSELTEWKDEARARWRQDAIKLLKSQRKNLGQPAVKANP